jgi:hypothetical protein
MSSEPRKRSRSTADTVAGKTKPKRAPVKVAADLDVVMKRCRELRKNLEQKESTKQSQPEEISEKDIIEVAELSATEVVEGIEHIALGIAKQVLGKQGFSLVRSPKTETHIRVWYRTIGMNKVEQNPSPRSSSYTLILLACLRISKKMIPLYCILLNGHLPRKAFDFSILIRSLIFAIPHVFYHVQDIPSRASSNQIYVKEWDRIVLGGKRSSRSFINVKESRKSTITLRVMQLLHAVLVKKIHITKRDLFYTDVKLFVDQAESDGVLDDIATMVKCTRTNLHVVASDKGLVVGRIQFEEDGDEIDW